MLSRLRRRGAPLHPSNTFKLSKISKNIQLQQFLKHPLQPGDGFAKSPLCRPLIVFDMSFTELRCLHMFA